MFNICKRTTYDGHFGGVVAMTTRDFAAVNGYSNCFWGWGAEDDDLYLRVTSHNFTVTRPKPMKRGRYTCLSHREAKPNPDRVRVLRSSAERRSIDGLVNLRYHTLSFQLAQLYTNILVDLSPLKNASLIDNYL